MREVIPGGFTGYFSVRRGGFIEVEMDLLRAAAVAAAVHSRRPSSATDDRSQSASNDGQTFDRPPCSSEEGTPSSISPTCTALVVPVEEVDVEEPLITMNTMNC